MSILKKMSKGLERGEERRGRIEVRLREGAKVFGRAKHAGCRAPKEISSP